MNGGSLVTATVSGSTITVVAKTTGVSTNYTVSASCTYITQFFNSCDFSASGASMSGGANAVGGGTTLYSYNVTYYGNGNVATLADSVMGTWTYSNASSYDSLNRLTQAASTAGLFAGVTINWSYDAFGNRLTQTPSGTNSGLVPAHWAQYGGNNRVTAADQAVAGYTYSASGNVLNDGINQYTYDAASRILTVAPTVLHSVVAQYVYDAEGHRVARLDGSGHLTASWVVGPGGEQMTEMNGSGGWVHSNIFAGKLLATYDANGTHFQASDWLGTRRAQISATGKLEMGFQSLPFGDELTPVAGCALLPSGPCATAPDSTEHHFTGKERDTESGNDYFEARYYSSSMGRFMSPDWAAKATPVPYAKLSNPQSLNLYAYVLNNPLGFADPDGHWVPLTGDDADRLKQLNGYKSAVGAQAGAYLYDNVVDGNHYLGIYTNGPDGKGPSFESINGASKEVGDVVGDTGRKASIEFDPQGTTFGKLPNRVTLGPMDAGQSPAVTTYSKDGTSATIHVTTGGFGEMPGDVTSDGRSTWISFGDIISHEFGHVDSRWFHGDSGTDGNSVRMENTTRRMEGGAIRMFHTKPGDTDLGGTTY